MSALGLIVNPIAGIGGRLALKGSDDRAAVDRAVRNGAPPVAAARARRTLHVLRAQAPGIEVLAAGGGMGAELAEELGLAVTLLGYEPARPTTAEDTRAAARELLERDVDLLLFAGGDGTARDVVSVVGTELPVLGIPSGVKMRSAVFATTPEAAGEAAARYLTSPDAFPLVEREVLDAADGDRERALRARTLPARRRAAPGGQGDGPSGRRGGADRPLRRHRARDDARSPVPRQARGRRPAGSSTPSGSKGRRSASTRCSTASCSTADLDEDGMLRLLDAHPEATLVLGVIGGQGFLLGRGNQQISARVLRRVGTDNLVIVAGADKVAALDPPVLHVDLGDDERENLLEGYRRVRVAPDRSMVLRVSGDDARRTKGGTALATRMIPDQAHPYMAISPPGVVDEMLAEIGLDDVDELFEQIPESHRLSRPIELPPAIRAEAQLKRHLTEILSRNATCAENLSFLGAGCWQHYVPAVCDEIISRSEFLTPVWGTPGVRLRPEPGVVRVREPAGRARRHGLRRAARLHAGAAPRATPRGWPRGSPAATSCSSPPRSTRSGSR